MIERKPIIGVMGSHEKEYPELTGPIGRLIAEHDYHLLTGAGGGVMSAVSKAFVEVEGRSGTSIGVVPTIDYDGSFVPREMYPNPYIELPIITPLGTKEQNAAMPFSRNYVNIMTSHAVIILPGDVGTRDESSLCLRYKKPAILFGPKDAFTSFPDQITRVSDLEEVREFMTQTRAKIRKDAEEIEQELLGDE